MEEAMVGGYETVIERLERAAGILGGETMAGALGVSEEVVERYLTGEVAYPEEGEWMERLELLDEMCDSLGGLLTRMRRMVGTVCPGPWAPLSFFALRTAKTGLWRGYAVFQTSQGA